MLKKILLLVFASLLVLGFFYLKEVKAYHVDESKLERHNYLNLSYTVANLNKLLIGTGEIQPSESGQSSPKRDFGAVGALTNLMGQMYFNPPISGAEYLSSAWQNLSIGKPVHAQGPPGIGFNRLTPVQQLWVLTRNVAYVGFVLIFVVVGFMIMLRARIDPRTVATVQAAIPGIVIALILVTLSYAIAGFIIDLTEVLLRLIGAVFAEFRAGGFIPLINQIETGVGDVNIFELMKKIIGPIFDPSGPWEDLFVNLLENIPFIGFLSGLPGLDEAAGGIFQIIVAIAVVFAMFRVFMMLLTALVTIVLMTIGAPLMLLAAAIPGRGGVVFGWLRGIGSAALTFPLTFLMLMLAAIFANATQDPWSITGTTDIQNFSWSPAPLGFFTTIEAVLSKLIALGILLTTPRAADMIREAFQQRVPAWAGEAGAALGGAARRIIPFA